ncbi:G-type lectin S-receptor-like serine/threonine-protein kinase SD2-5 [Carex rostrata]
MLPQMAFTSNIFSFVALLLCFSFSVNPQPLNHPTAIAPSSWTNSPSFQLAFTFNGGETIRSILFRHTAMDEVSFGTGFYCFPPCKSFYLSIYIIYSTYHELAYFLPPQVIWSANRAHPVSENATLQLTSKDGLTLHDSDGSLVWSTSVMNRSVAGINITEAGNLVLYDINNSTIWQSFDHPTDCLVMGQTLAGGMRIIANSSSTDLAESQFYLTLLADGLFGFVNSNPPMVYYYDPTSFGYSNSYQVYNDTSNKTANKTAFMQLMDGYLGMFSTLSNDSAIIFRTLPAKSIQYMRLESDGHLKLYDCDGYEWKMVDDLLSMDSDMDSYFPKLSNCDYPTFCGHYGICNNGQCTCPTGTSGNYFKPVDDRRAELGCYAVTNITCQDVKNHRLLKLNDVSYFNNVDNVAFDATDEQTCKNACLRNCSCKGALFQSSNGNLSYGKCLTLSEVFSLKNYQPEGTNLTSSAFIKVQVSSSKVGLDAILGSTFGALLFVLTLICIYFACLRKREEAQDEDIMEQLPGMPNRFTFEELRIATENFVKILGKGGFGTVFEGTWGDGKIAVKRLDNIGHGKKDFLTEVETIGNIHHINLVRLIGFCADKLNRILVYEYMCNGSLDQWIYCKDGRVPLDWPMRFKIITDIAKGLCYLHEECMQKIVHFDIKPENILLDEKFHAKVSDFGLSKLIDRDISRVMTKMRGTPGYLAPEWLTAMVTEKVDVYSFGVVVMEILSGRRNLDYSQIEGNLHLIKLLEEKSKSNTLLDLIDKNLGDVELYKKEIVNVIELSMWCLQWDSTRRPSMLMVVKVLEGAMEVATSLDYNFVSSIPLIANIPSVVDQSAPFPASVLSGPR